MAKKKDNMATAKAKPTAKKLITASTLTVPLTVLETVSIPPGDIDTGATCKGRIAPIGDDAVQSMAISMLTYGQLQPVGCYRLEDGTPRLIYGYTRQRAGLLIVSGFTKSGVDGGSDVVFPPAPDFVLRCEIVEKPSDDDLLIRTLSENAQRKDTNRMDDAVNQQLLRDAGLTDQKISRIYGYASSATVMRLRQLLDLSDTWQARIAAGTVTMAAGCLVTDWSKDADKQDRLLAIGVTADPSIAEHIGQSMAEWLIKTHGPTAFGADDTDLLAPTAPDTVPADATPVPATAETPPEGTPTPEKRRAATAKEIKEALNSAHDPAGFTGAPEDTVRVILGVIAATRDFAEGKTTSFAAYLDALRALCQ